MEILKYPIGKFTRPESISSKDRKDWIHTLDNFPKDLSDAVEDWTEEQFNTPYREGSWTVRELIHHIADSHINAMRRFKLGLTENNPTIKTYKQDKWSELADYQEVDAKVSLQLIHAIHKRLVCILNSLGEEEFKRTIYRPKMKRAMRLEGLLALYAWHSRHHLEQIRQLKTVKSW